MEQPIFEIIDGDKHYRIWWDGLMKGFNLGNKAIIINRIPCTIAQRIAEYIQEDPEGIWRDRKK